MAGAIQLTEVDFEQIKLNLINYLKSTKEFTDYDFEGSNLQVILNLISYQAQLNAYSTNMIANESFLSSATLRDNVVANARSLGYLPTSARSATSRTSFSFTLSQQDFPAGFPLALEILPGPMFITATGQDNFTFNIVDAQSAPVSSLGECNFTDVTVYEGFYLTAEFTVDKSNFNQKFILENQNIDSSTIRVEVQENPSEQVNAFYEQANNLVQVSSTSRVYWLEEVDSEYYQLTFGDGLFGRELRDGAKIFVYYVQSSGPAANGIQGINNFNFVSPNVFTSTGVKIPSVATTTAASVSEGGANIESVSSIKFRAPKYYGTQSRAVIAEDYETLIRQIYPAVADIYVYGGEELSIPEYGRVFVTIKPSTGNSLSNITKNYIIESLSEYRIASLEVVLVDPSILYVEVETVAYYNDKLTIKDSTGIVSSIRQVLTSYAAAETVSKFGGAVRFSRIVGAIDDADPSIGRNNTELRMRTDFTAVTNTPASYEVCFENALKVNTNQPVVYSTGFYLLKNGINDGEVYYFEDDTFGNVYTYYFDEVGNKVLSDPSFGTVDYETGEIMIGYVNPVIIVATEQRSKIISVRGVPRGQDVVARKSVYLQLDIANSDINAVIDTNILSE